MIIISTEEGLVRNGWIRPHVAVTIPPVLKEYESMLNKLRAENDRLHRENERLKRES